MKATDNPREPRADQFDKTQEFPIDAIQKSTAPSPVSDKEGEEFRLLKQALIESKKCYQAMIETNLYGVMEIDVSGIIVFANSVMHTILGYGQGELKGKVVWDLLSDNTERDKLTQRLTDLSAGKYAPFPWTGKFVRKNKTSFELQIDWNYRRDKQGRVIGFISVISDIVDKLGQKDLTSADVWYRRMVEAIPDMLITADLDGNITYINPAGIELIGYFEEELLSMNIGDIFSPESVNNLKKSLFSRNAEKTGIQISDISLIRRDLKMVPMDINASLIMKSEEPSEMLILAREVTRQKQIEQELFLNQKFEAVSTFANGMIQDLHDYITQILTNIDLAQMVLDPSGNIYKRLNEAKDGCSGIRDLTRQFVIFSKGGIPMKNVGSLKCLIEAVAQQIFKLSNIQAKFDFSDDLWEVAFDERQLRQVMENLLTNARDASPPGSQIIVKMENVDVSLHSDDIPVTVKEGKYVRISIQNSGSGIAEADLKRIFDPYFSTKKMRTKKGMGLGLTIAYSIIRQHNGYIYVESIPEVKTIFFILLPAFRKEMREKGAKKAMVLESSEL